MAEIMSSVTSERDLSDATPENSVIPPLKHFKQGDARYKGVNKGVVDHPSVEEVPLADPYPLTNVDISPIGDHRYYGDRTRIQNTEKDAIIHIEENVDEAKRMMQYWRDIGIPHAPDPERIISVPLKDYALFADAVVADASNVRARIQELFGDTEDLELLVSMHSQPVDTMRDALGLKTLRKNYVSAILVDNNSITHTLLDERFKNDDSGLYVVPNGDIVNTEAEAMETAVRLFAEKPEGKVVVRLPHGASGLGIIIARNIEEFKKALKEKKVSRWLEKEGENKYHTNKLITKIQNGAEITPEELELYVQNPCGLKVEAYEAPVEGGNSLSMGVKLHIGKTEADDSLLGISEQKLAAVREGDPETDHQGNIYYKNLWDPKLEGMLKICADYMRKMGAYGPNGIDLLVLCNKNDEIEKIVLMEINSRNTAPSYTYRLTQKITGTPFPEKSYTGINVQTGRDFDELREAISDVGLEYNSETQTGVLIASVTKNMRKAMLYVLEDSKELVDVMEAKIHKSLCLDHKTE